MVVAQSSAVGAMAAAGFLTASADTPGVKHLLSPLILHVGVLSLHYTSCCYQVPAVHNILGFTMCLDSGVCASPFSCKEMAEMIHDVVKTALEPKLPEILACPDA